MQRVPKQTLLDFVVAVLDRKGVVADRAAYLADIAVRTEAFGIHTHGLRLVASWDAEVGKSIDPVAEPAVVRETGAAAVIDGRGTFGHLALRLGMDVAVAKAREHGVAMVAGSRMSWLGAIGPQIAPLAEAGFFAQCWVQQNTCRDCAPWGGIDPRFSTNPVALAFPAGGTVMVSDFSTAAISMGRTKGMIARGERAPENLYLDSDGRPTDDPRVMEQGGSLLFTGGERFGYRGYALSLWAEALTAMADGSANNPDAEPSQAFNLTVIDPEAFGERDAYEREMARFVAHLRSSRLRPGFDAIFLPGERALAAAKDAETRGVPVEEPMLERMNAIAEAHGLPQLGEA